jgi:5-methylcytosine-specific restriction endonuclease McrA
MANRPQQFRPRASRPFVTQDRKEAERFYNSRAWRLLRRQKLAQDSLCEMCLERDGTLTAATQCHHIIDRADAPERALSINNLASLCTACHSRITITNTRSKNEKRMAQ